MALPEKLYALRKKSGLSQEQLAEALNVSRQAISKWEGGSATPESDKLLALSNYFGVSLDYLLKDGAPDAAPAEAQEEHRSTRLLSLILCLGGAAAQKHQTQIRRSLHESSVLYLRRVGDPAL